jgi:YfiH family protein
VSVIESQIFTRLEWIDHGFGTRGATLSQDQMASLKQIHSPNVLAANCVGCVGEGDALITATAGVAVSVRTADCFPVLLADARQRVVAAVHAGWRGTAARIVPAALDLMRAKFDTSPADVYAAIGPGIGGCCYEVGEDVAQHFGLEGAGHVDLDRINRDQLVAAGVPEGHIDSMGLCTFCDATRFHSHRRDRHAAGRMISFIRIRPNGG